LHLQKDFQRALKSGRRLSHPALVVYMYGNTDGTVRRRLGLITRRQLGTAVQRNRLKRRLREIFRLHKDRLAPGLDMIFMPKLPVMSLTYAQLREVITSLWLKAGVLCCPGEEPRA
jgi:ribonuclease P protein component